MAVKKKVTEIRDDIFFRKLLDVSKNAVFIGWSGIYRKEYQSLLKDNLLHLRELSIIENAGFDSTNISVALYVFSEEISESYVSKVYDGDKVIHEEVFKKGDGEVEYAKKPIPKEDLRPKVSDFFKTVSDYMDFEVKTKSDSMLRAIKKWEDGEGEAPWKVMSEERVAWGEGGNAMLSNLSFQNYVKSIEQDLMFFKSSGDVSILHTLSSNLASLDNFRRKVDTQIAILEIAEEKHGI